MDKIAEAYKNMMGSYEGTKSVNREPTEEEIARDKKLGMRWEYDAKVPMNIYVKATNQAELLKAQNEGPEAEESRKRAQEFIRLHKHAF